MSQATSTVHDADLSLAELRRQLAEAQRIGRIGSWEWDIPADRLSWTDEVFRLCGLEPQSFLPTFEIFLQLIHPDDRHRVRQTSQAALAAITPFVYDYRVVAPDGEMRWLHCRGDVVAGPDGHPIKMHGTAQDITARKLAEEDLRRSEARYRLLAENTDDIIILMDARGIMQYVSPASERQTGFTADELVGTPGFVQIHPDDRQVVRDLAGQDATNIMLRIRRKAGDYLWVETTIKHLRDPLTGEVRELLATARNISDRVEAGEELIRIRQLLDEAQQLAGVGSWEIDMATGRVTWSAGMYHLYEVSLESAINPHDLFWQTIHPEDLERVRETKEAARKAGLSYEFEHRVVLTNGTMKHMHSRAHFVSEPGHATRLVGTTQDVTERRRAHEALRASEAQYRLIAENSGDQIALTDLTGKTLYISPASRRLLGREPESLVGTSPFEDIHPDDLPAVMEALQVLNDGREVPNITVRLSHGDGGYIWVEASTRLVRDERTGEIQVLSVTRDITKRKEAEARLVRSQSILTAQQEGSIEGILLVDEHGRVVSFNRRYLDLWKIPEAVIDSRDDNALLDFVGRQLVDPEHFRARVDYLYQHPMEIDRDEIHFKDGRVLDRYSTPALSPQGDYYGRLWYFRDITDRKQAERELRLITEGTASVTGQAFFQALVGHLAEALGVRYAFIGELTRSDTAVRTLAVWADTGLAADFTYDLKGTPCDTAVELQECYYRDSVQHMFPEDLMLGDMGVESYWGLRLQDLDGRTLGLMGVMHDAPYDRNERAEMILKIFATRATAEMERLRSANELAQSAAELLEANEHLKELDRHKVNYINSVSHELRTPLTSIIGYTEFLEDTLREKDDEESLEFVAQVRHSTQRIQRLVDDLLDFALIEAGTFKLNFESTDFCAKANEVVESLRPQVEKARVTLETDIPDCPLMLKADPQRVSQVLLNFLTNALKFSPRGGTITLRARSQDGRLLCEVTDSGPGIAPEDQPKLFMRYSQLQVGARKGGTGLGLSISKALIDAHGGQIGMRSEPGQGSTFWFSLPVS